MRAGACARAAVVAVVDDDQRIRAALRRALRLEGYSVLEGRDGVEGEQLVTQADAMVLDATMPNLGGFELCRRLRSQGSRLPILLLTARTSTADRVEGLDAGADDYLPKPFALDELLARLRALLRRTTDIDAEAERLWFGGIVMDTASYEVTNAGEPVSLTRTEHRLLELFLRNPGRGLGRDAIYDAVWGYDASLASNSLEVYVGYLRRKLAESAAAPDGRSPIRTVRGVGYVLRDS